jgi:hypothetical protein
MCNTLNFPGVPVKERFILLLFYLKSHYCGLTCIDQQSEISHAGLSVKIEIADNQPNLLALNKEFCKLRYYNETGNNAI